MNSSNSEDSVTKMIRLIANLLTEEQMRTDLKHLKSFSLNFFEKAITLLKQKSPSKSEECVLNIVACFTNFLFYSDIFPEEQRLEIEKQIVIGIHSYIY